MFPYLPEGLDDFVEQVVPELQRRGLFRTEYEGATLRENLGLPRPANRFFEQSGVGRHQRRDNGVEVAAVDIGASPHRGDLACRTVGPAPSSRTPYAFQQRLRGWGTIDRTEARRDHGDDGVDRAHLHDEPRLQDRPAVHIAQRGGRQ